MMMNFCSDNVAGITPEILAAIGAANTGASASYGADQWTAKLDRHLAEIFERRVIAFPVTTGTPGQAPAPSIITPPYLAIYFHDQAPIPGYQCAGPGMCKAL